MRSTYTVAPYAQRIVFTDSVKEFHALRADTAFSAAGLLGACASGKTCFAVVGVFDGKLFTLVHEAVHAAAALLQEVGIDPLSNQSEPLAYLVDHLTAVGSKRLRLR